MALRRNEFYYTFPYFPLTVSVSNPALVTKRNWFLIAVCNWLMEHSMFFVCFFPTATDFEIKDLDRAPSEVTLMNYKLTVTENYCISRHSTKMLARVHLSSKMVHKSVPIQNLGNPETKFFLFHARSSIFLVVPWTGSWLPSRKSLALKGYEIQNTSRWVNTSFSLSTLL